MYKDKTDFIKHLKNSFLLLGKLRWKIVYPILLDIISFVVFSTVAYYLQIQILEKFEKLIEVKEQLDTSVSQNTLAFALELATKMQQHLNELLLLLLTLVFSIIAIWILIQPFSWLILARMKEKVKVFDYFSYFSYLTIMSSVVSFIFFGFVINYIYQTSDYFASWIKPSIWIISILLTYMTIVGYALLPQKSFKELLIKIPKAAFSWNAIAATLTMVVVAVLSYVLFSSLYAFQPRISLIVGFFWVFLLWSWSRLYLIEVIRS